MLRELVRSFRGGQILESGVVSARGAAGEMLVF